jgi:hypothetical protein
MANALQRTTAGVITGMLALVLTMAVPTAAQAPQQPGIPARPPQGTPPRTPARDPRATTPVPAGTGVMRGQVVAADSGTPIRRAQVRVRAQAPRESRLATTDAQGYFEFRDLPAARYTMTASKGGFVTLEYGQRRPGESGTPLELADGQKLDKLVIGLPRGSVIGGRLTDEYGEPVANAVVMALRYAYAGGARRLEPAGARDTTDDQGHYRLFGLPPGDYIVSARLRAAEVTDPGDETSGYAATFFPGTPNPSEAQRVRLALAQENTGVSFALIAARLVTVSGTVITSTGGPPPGGTVALSATAGVRGDRDLAMGGSARIDGTGAFRIPNVAPGRYQVVARSGARGAGEFARLDLTVGGDDVAGLTLVTAPGARVSGTVVSDTGDAFPFPPSEVRVLAQPAVPDALGGGGGGGGDGRVNADSSFSIANVIDPRLFRVNAPQGWVVHGVTLNSQDITDVPVDFAPGQTVTGVQVVLTRTVASLSGLVVDDGNQPMLDATVVAFPADDSRWTYLSRFIRTARPNQEGRFQITPLPAGDYLIVAVQGLEDGQAGSPDFLAAVKSAAAAVTLKPGEARTMNVRLATR